MRCLLLAQQWKSFTSGIGTYARGLALGLSRVGNEREPVPVLFDVEGAIAEPHEAMVVVVEDEGRRIGLVADQLLGQQSIVIKSLGDAVQANRPVDFQ